VSCGVENASKTGARRPDCGITRDVADLAFVLAGALAFTLMALFAWALEILVQHEDDKGSSR
jgi:hypothetical protein